MCQVCFRSLPEAPSTRCVCVCVGVWVSLCVCAIACSHNNTLRIPDVHNPLIQLVWGHAYMCQDCVRSLLEAPSILWDTLCVCVCVCI